MKISIIVPIYKGNHYIDGILTMIENNVQDICISKQNIAIDLLLINDSPDLPIKNERLKQKLGFEVQVICNKRNYGIHGSRVQGLKKAKGDYILFLDQDDKISNDWISRQLESIGSADVCIGNGYKVYSNNKKIIYKNIKKQKLVTKEEIYLKAACQIVSPGQCLIRREAIPQEWLDNIISINGSDDIFLWILMFEQRRIFTINTAQIYEHIDTGRNVSNDSQAMIESAYNAISLLKKCGNVSEKNIKSYEKRIKFMEQSLQTKGIGKLVVYIKNLDICAWKVYAHYR